MGLQRNLKAFEIIDQVLTSLDHLSPDQSLTNIVLMGMGESLANFEAVAEAIHRMTNKGWGLGISPKRITLSTAGLVSRLNDVAALGVNLAISLNATTNETREQLMPAVNKLYPLKTLLDACKQYPLLPRQRLTFEYVLLAGVNDTIEDAVRLTKLLKGIPGKVNLIPFNEFPGSDFSRPADSDVLRFQTRVKQAGIPAFIRKSKGREVLGACGQLGNRPASPSVSFLTPIGANC
jgi:23S rRNA (adenine2503-C2)-methyltransferase